MLKANLTALMAAALMAGAFTLPVQAGHATGHHAPYQMPGFDPHHGTMGPGAAKNDRPRLGVAISALPQADLEAKSLEYGVRIDEILEGSAAEAAGLRVGDVVTAVDGRPAYSPERMQYLVKQSNDAAKLTLMRGDESLKLSAAFAQPKAPGMTGRAMLGIRIQEMTTDLKEAFGSEDERGVLISQVMRNSAASRAGLRAGDVLVSVGGDRIMAVKDVHSALRGHSPGDSLDIAIVRDRQESTVQVALGGVPGAQTPSAAPAYGHGDTGRGSYGHHGMMPKHGCSMGQMYRPS
ncbi:MAG: PDZ domain-containing protein [Sedimenticolaceae bacterium]